MAIERPKLKLHRGSTYVFDVSSPTLASHPFKFTNDSGTTEYTNGVTASGNSGTVNATVTFAVPNDAPDTLYYQCGSHDGMYGILHIRTVASSSQINVADGRVWARHLCRPRTS